MKILLTAPNIVFVDIQSGVPYLSLYLLAAVLSKKGHHVIIVDPAQLHIRLPHGEKIEPLIVNRNKDTFLSSEQVEMIDAKARQLIYPNLIEAAKDVDLVGISSNSFQWIYAKTMIQNIKEACPTVPIVVGGAHPTHLPQNVLETSGADFAIRGDGEYSLGELAHALESKGDLTKISGLSYKKDRRIIHNESAPNISIDQLEDNPLPAFDLLPEDSYGSIGVETARGCRNHCKFCSVPMNKSWRGMNLERTLSYVTYAMSYKQKLKETSENLGLVFLDDDFTGDVQRAQAILSSLRKTNLDSYKVIFQARLKPTIESKIPDLLSELPLSTIEFGIECGYDAGLKKIGKGITVEIIKDGALSLAKHKISQHAIFSFMLGLPWESKAEILQTLDLEALFNLKYDIHIQNSWYNLLPGCDFWMNRKKLGIDLGPEIFDSHFYVSLNILKKTSPNLSDDDRKRIMDKIYLYNMLSILKGSTGTFRIPFVVN